MPFVTAGAQASIWATLLLCLLLAVSMRTGIFALRSAGIPLSGLSFLEAGSFGLGTGLTLLALLVLGLGSAGALQRPYAWGLLALMSFIPAKAFGRAHGATDGPAGKPAAIAAAFILLSWLQALAPPTGNDALAYHLAYPREFILNGRIGYLPFTRESLWPFQTEMLFTLGLLLQGTTLAQLFHWLFYPLTAALVYAYGRRFHPGSGAVSALAFLAVPAAFAQSGQAYVDLALAFFIFAAVFAFRLRDELGAGRAAVLSGVLCGAAMGTKYLGLGAAAVLAALWLFRGKRTAGPALLFIAATATVSGVWYLRSWSALGNPVYPFFYQVFGGHGFAQTAGEHVGFGKSLPALAAFPWNVTMRPNAFGGEMLGPLFLAFLPPLLIRRDKPGRSAAELSLFAAGYGLFLFSQSQHARFLLSLVPFLCVGVGASFQRLRSAGGAASKAAAAVLALTLLAHGGIAIHRAKAVAPASLGLVTIENFLAQKERSFGGYAFFKEQAKPGETVFNAAEARRFYNQSAGMKFDSEALRQSLETQGRTIESYLDEHRFHFLWMRQNADPTLSAYALKRGYRERHRYSFTEKPAMYSYVIYESV